MIVFFLLLVIAAMALGILGIVVKGLFYLLFTGIGLLLVAFLLVLQQRSEIPGSAGVVGFAGGGLAAASPE
jgi:hypothetical protein